MGFGFVNMPFLIAFCLCVATSSCEISDMNMSFPASLFSCKSNLFSHVLRGLVLKQRHKGTQK